MGREAGHPARLALITAGTVLPVRAIRIAALVTGQCARAGALADLARTAPLVAAGHLASLFGEAVALVGRGPRSGPGGA